MENRNQLRQTQKSCKNRKFHRTQKNNNTTRFLLQYTTIQLPNSNKTINRSKKRRKNREKT